MGSGGVYVCVEGGRLTRRSHSVFTCHLASEHLPDPRTIYEPEQPHAPAAETASGLLILFCAIFLFVFVAHMYKNSPLHMRLRLNYTHIFRPLIFDSVVTLSPLPPWRRERHRGASYRRDCSGAPAVGCGTGACCHSASG